MAVLEVECLSKRFGDKQVLDALSFSVGEHSIFGFIGKNGAGKTTTMKAILGLLPIDGGTIRVLSYESEGEYFVSVTDDGVGFDTKTLADERGHVGLRNIRERLRVMVNGTLEIESTVGVGTRVLIRIPKEAGK